MKIAMGLEADLFSLNFGLPSSVDLGRRRCRTACKYAVKVDVDVATLRPFGQILYRSVHWPTKIALSAGAGAELRLDMLSTRMSTSPLCGRLAKFYTAPCTGRRKLASRQALAQNCV